MFLFSRETADLEDFIYFFIVVLAEGVGAAQQDLVKLGTCIRNPLIFSCLKNLPIFRG